MRFPTDYELFQMEKETKWVDRHISAATIIANAFLIVAIAAIVTAFFIKFL